MKVLHRRLWLPLLCDLERLEAHLHNGYSLERTTYYAGQVSGWQLRDRRDDKCPHCGLTVYPQPYHERDDPACKVPA
jgi:hypothetical protein